MMLFGKEIKKAYIIDFFPDPALTDHLKLFLNQQVLTKVLVPTTLKDVCEFLTTIEGETDDVGCLLHLVGHGDSVKQGFGRQGLSLKYEEIINPFSRINAKTGDKLIVNASLMCLTDPFHNIYSLHVNVFHACIYSTLTRTSQSLNQMINIYKKCATGIDTRTAIDQENDAIEDAQGIRPFGYT